MQRLVYNEMLAKYMLVVREVCTTQKITWYHCTWYFDAYRTIIIIVICSYCVLDRPGFEWNQVLLHPELTPWWSFLFPDGVHHKIPHSPTHCIYLRESKLNIYIYAFPIYTANSKYGVILLQYISSFKTQLNGGFISSMPFSVITEPSDIRTCKNIYICSLKMSPGIKQNMVIVIRCTMIL